MRIGPGLAVFFLALATFSCRSEASRAAQAKKALGDAKPEARAAAAAELRRLAKADPRVMGDHGAAHWRSLLATIPDSASSSDIVRVTGSTPGSYGTEGPYAVGYRLDDFWVVVASVDLQQRLQGMHSPERVVLTVEAPAWPRGYSGKWLAYYVSGVVFSESELRNGHVERYRAFFENARLHWESLYANGKLDGNESYFREDGSREQLLVYRAGSELGRATWDSRGKLLSATGAAERVVGELQ